MSLLTICQAAMGETLGTVPTYVIGNPDPNVVKSLYMVNRLGYDLQRSRKWPELKTTYTFTTVPGQASYPLPTSIQRMSNSSHWDRTSHFPMNGPATDAFWQVLESGLVIAGMRFWFRIDNSGFDIAPTPVDARTIAYDYYTTTWAASATGTPQDSMIADTDVAAFLPGNRADDLLTLGLIWRLKESIGLPFGNDQTRYANAVDDESFDSKGEPLIDVTGAPRYVLGRGNIPEINYGR